MQNRMNIIIIVLSFINRPNTNTNSGNCMVSGLSAMIYSSVYLDALVKF